MLDRRALIAEELAKGGMSPATIDEYGVDVVEEVMRVMPGGPTAVAQVVCHAAAIGSLDGANIRLVVTLLRLIADLYDRAGGAVTA